MASDDEREALAQRYCPVHGDLLAGARSPRCSEAPKGHEFLHRQGQITDAMLLAAMNAKYPDTQLSAEGGSGLMTDDIKALVTELREVKPTWDAARRAADTIEALEAENESLRITLAARDRA